MNIDSEDQKIRDELSNLGNLPKSIDWNAITGWEQYKKKYKRRKKIMVIQWISVAATLLFGLLLMLNELPYSKDNKLLELNSDDNKKAEMVLADGSKIWLNYNSSLTVNLKNSEIELEGEAYFELSTKIEYKIRSLHGKYLTKASAFNLKTRKREDSAILSVSKGKVNIIWGSDNTQKPIVEAGIQARIVPNVAVVNIPIYDTNYLSWKTEELHFDNTPLYCVIDKLEELNHIEIDVADINIRYCRISSDFKTVATKEVLQKISEYLNYTIEYKGNILLIKGTGCNM